ncbi:MAG: hypothetical protein AAFV92_08450 [Pseudomonadota bacterium]
MELAFRGYDKIGYVGVLEIIFRFRVFHLQTDDDGTIFPAHKLEIILNDFVASGDLATGDNKGRGRVAGVYPLALHLGWKGSVAVKSLHSSLWNWDWF